MPCQKCLNSPGFHSFSNIGKFNNIDVFYTSVSKGQDNTTDGSKIKNIKLHFEEDPAGKEWIWVLDCSNMGTSHYTDLAFNIELTKTILTNKKINNIWMIRQNAWIKSIHALCMTVTGAEHFNKFTYFDGSNIELFLKFKEMGLNNSLISKILS